MLKHVNVKELEKKFVKLQAELIILRCRFYREATVSLNKATQEFETWRANDGGYTEYGAWILGIARGLENTLNTEGIQAFMDAFDELDYSEYVQFNHEWWSLGLAIESTEEQLKELHKQLLVAKQNCQMKQAFKDAGF